MGEMRKIDVAVSEDLASEIDAAVASGEFATVDAAIAEALNAWSVGRQPYDHENTLRLRRLWEEGIASGPPIEGNFDLADIKRRAAERKSAALRDE